LFLKIPSSYIIPIFPSSGYKFYRSPNPPLITGFLFLDSLISGNGYLALEILYHYTLPSIILTVAITALTIKLLSSQVVKDSYKKHTIFSHTAKTIVMIGAILTYLFLIDDIFRLEGLGSYFLNALRNQDVFLIRGFLFIFIILFSLTIFISNLFFSLNRKPKEVKVPVEKIEAPVEGELLLSPKIEFKNYINKIKRSPQLLIGLVAFLILLHALIFPELISGYTFEQAMGVYPKAWHPPSLEHFLGTAMFGRDVLALIVYGTRNALIFGAGASFIGLIGGLVFGLPASKYYRKVYKIIMILMLVFYLYPGILLFFFLSKGFEYPSGSLMYITGLLLVPWYTRILANTKFRLVPLSKKVFSYVPLFTGFAILFYASIGFLGFNDYQTIHLGNLISEASIELNSPFALMGPSALLCFIILTLFMLHDGLVKHSR
jgi:peptide/nickel transport system permease protein